MKEIVESLAVALDADNYEAAHTTLAANVRYEVKGLTLIGPDAVVDSYRGASEQAHELFDGVGYDHEITQEGDNTYVISYRDILTIAEETVIHHARQDVTVVDGEVVQIVNVELDGQRELVDEFLARHGRSR